jgi:hypothetical protein
MGLQSRAPGMKRHFGGTWTEAGAARLADDPMPDGVVDPGFPHPAV